ncbi:hypothetical protein CRENBAI_013120 [Crenichthys baileyi]|uniref:Uncharacterized protein n=1 Tax=Crenichthys baileyi TaxID=28760 RepID=A0AAV9SL32_9TELE
MGLFYPCLFSMSLNPLERSQMATVKDSAESNWISPAFIGLEHKETEFWISVALCQSSNMTDWSHSYMKQEAEAHCDYNAACCLLFQPVMRQCHANSKWSAFIVCKERDKGEL